MDDVRLTPAERRALEQIEGELRKDRDLDRALRRMRAPRPSRKALRRRAIDPPAGTADGGVPGEADAAAGERAAHGHPVDRGAERPAADPSDHSDERVSGRAVDHTGDRRRIWALAVVLTVVFSALLTAGTMYFVAVALVLATLATTAAAVWICVGFYLRRPGTG
ncbi:hypothetical protein [Yinghuangia seranimata]|uniref:hypothetical protein n=1 Tax=Yinghuangia seranimata TaxID=408067 RepID=UPI00248ABE96|nr:hypothetical protein [Yinghuangia seranimata]MDI2126047.1 hypothetical protein [Yinghuangia seranimata]